MDKNHFEGSFDRPDDSDELLNSDELATTDNIEHNQKRQASLRKLRKKALVLTTSRVAVHGGDRETGRTRISPTGSAVVATSYVLGLSASQQDMPRH